MIVKAKKNNNRDMRQKVRQQDYKIFSSVKNIAKYSIFLGRCC